MLPRIHRRQFLTAGAAALAVSSVFAQRGGFVPSRCDLLVYGSTPAGIAAAISAARAGLFVVLVEPTKHFGGMVTGGMSNTDFKTFEAVQGIYREFMNRIVTHYRNRYGANSAQVEACYHGAWYEPSAASTVFGEMLDEAGVRYWLGQRLTGVTHEGEGSERRIAFVSLANVDDGFDRETAASVYIDATYEGDLMAMAGCENRTGRESRAEYGELFAGVKYFDEGKFLHGSTGEGDHRIQCYNFRLCMTDVLANQIPVPKPEAYVRDEFMPLLAVIKERQFEKLDGNLVRFRRIPNGKADVNDLMYSPISLRLPGENYEWPGGDWETRARIFERHKAWTLGFFYFLQNDPEVPESLRSDARRWALPKDEFVATGGFPPILYIREGRRLKSSFVLTEKDTQRTPGSVRSPLYEDAVAVCDYSLDSHGNAAAGHLHPGITEGVFNWYVVPYQIPYRVMVPKEVANLLVPVAVSASHVAYSSLRMEPTWTALGQAAGFAAAQAVSQKRSAEQVDVSALQETLHAANAITVYLSDVLPGSPHFRASQHFGTHGAFHELPEYRKAPYAGRGKSLKGQWLEAYPQHAVSPEEPMTGELAQQWATLAEIDEAPPHEGRSRGRFLNELYAKVTS